MKKSFTKIAFTKNVKAMQKRMGVFELFDEDEEAQVNEPRLGPKEIAFIEARDSFYMATVSETGWPYVQHRGGPPGFLKVLDDCTIGYAEFTGNKQYVSVGNLAGDERVSLILMNYPLQKRLKIFGLAKVIEEESDAELLLRLDNPHYRAQVERGIVIHIEGFDWNCPKYITPRYTEDQIPQQFVKEISGSNQARDTITYDDLELRVSDIKQLTPYIRAYELRAIDGGNLPAVEAGSHIELQVRLADGSVVTRPYSIMTTPADLSRYEIAVLCENHGRGGSQTIHKTWHIGTQLHASIPQNYFPLHKDSRPAVLIAGGIGITPIREMVQTLKYRNSQFELHYTGRSPMEMAYMDWLSAEMKSNCFYYFSRVPGQSRLDVEKVLDSAPENAVFYICGPESLIKSARNSANKLMISPDRVIHESFF